MTPAEVAAAVSEPLTAEACPMCGRRPNAHLRRLLAVLRGGRSIPTSEYDEADNMCPNCVTPWKCNGPHLSDVTLATLDAALATPLSSEVERLRALERVAEAARRVARPPAHEATHVGHHTALRAAIADLDAKVKEMP